MKFGIREICDVVFRARSKMTLGSRTFYKNEPVIYFDTLTASSLEGASTTVYAQGGRGYARLIAWEGERTMTFNMTDALLSPEGFSILAGAGLVDAKDKPLYVHTTSQVEVEADNTIVLDTDEVVWDGFDSSNDSYKKNAGIFIMLLDEGEVASEPCIPAENGVEIAGGKTTITCYHAHREDGVKGLQKGDVVLVDYYVKKTAGAQQIEITPESFGAFFYVEASTLFRRESDGKDLAAEFVIPRAKVQSNFTFSMSPTGDPSTFDFVLDAFPDYTKFDYTKKVFAMIQIIDEDKDAEEAQREHCSKLDIGVSAYNGDDDLFGKTAADLQENLSVANGVASGTLKYVDDYTGFSSITSEQKGNFIALHADADEGSEIRFTVNGGTTVNKKLDADGIAVIKVANTSQSVTFTATKGDEVDTKTIAFSGLTLEPAE